MINDFNDFNNNVINEFRAKNGDERVNPLAYAWDAGRFYVFASYGGNPRNPPWYYNLLANPEVEVEVGNDKFNATATVVSEPERTDIYNKMANRAPNFAMYQEKTDRIIPVVELHWVQQR